MEITIKTKYSIGDMAYGVHNGNFFLFQINSIQLIYKSQWNECSTVYSCTSVPDTTNATYQSCLQKEFYEYELKTAEELMDLIVTLRLNSVK